jgi:hypothetical protein
MTGLIRGILAVVVACALGWGTASACNVQGRVVCTGTTTGVEGVGVTLDRIGFGDTYVTATDANGFFSTHVAWRGWTYGVTLDLGGGVLVPEDPVLCDLNGTLIDIPAYEVDAPACGTPPPPPPPPVTADCSPGFYKNHPETWCDACFAGVGCAQIVEELSSKGAGSAAIRDAAKASIDACFGTAAASPCVDDDR